MRRTVTGRRIGRLISAMPVGIAGGVVVVGLFVAAAAEAAVRQCRQAVTSDVIQAGSELDGKRQALQSWVAKARTRHGDTYATWRLANRRLLSCVPQTGGAALACVASAVPCRIEQVPGRPPGRAPLVRPRPGIAI